MPFVHVFSPSTEPELMTVVAMLQAHGIQCFVKNAAFSSLYPGVSMSAFVKRDIMVPEEDLEIAQELVRAFEDDST